MEVHETAGLRRNRWYPAAEADCGVEDQRLLSLSCRFGIAFNWYAPPFRVLKTTTHALLFFLVVVIHVGVAIQAEFPRGFYDELVYLGFARLFAGVADMPDLAEGGLGHFGYSVFLTPAYLVFEDFPAQYRGVLALNSLFLSSIYVTTYLLIRKLFSLSRTGAILAAAVASLYPTYVLFTGFAIADALFAPWYMLVLLLLYRYLSRPAGVSALLLSLAVGLSYALHARSLAIVICLWILALGLAWKKAADFRQVVVLLLVPAAFWIGVREANDALVAISGVEYPNGAARIASIIAKHPTAAITGAAGQLFYLSAASLQLYPLGLTALLAISFGSRQLPTQHPSVRLTAIFALVTHAAVLIGSVLFLLPEWLQGQPAKILSSRYPEGTLAIVLAAGAALIWLGGRDPNWRRLMWTGLLAGALMTGCSALFVAPYLPLDVLGGGLRFETISLIPLVRLLPPATYSKIAAASLLTALAVCSLTRLSRHAALGLMTLTFLAMAWLVQNHFSSIQSTIAAHIDSRVISVGSQLPKGSTVGYDLASWDSFTYSYYQLYLPDKKFVPFDSSLGQSPPPAAMLIAGSSLQLADDGYRRTYCKPFFGTEHCIWAQSSGLP